VIGKINKKHQIRKWLINHPVKTKTLSIGVENIGAPYWHKINISFTCRKKLFLQNIIFWFEIKPVEEKH